ncbi:MAG: hypothetical protein AAB575_02120 [Patescibacteria group bacterium]
MKRLSKLMWGLFFIGLAIFLIIGLVRYAPLFGFLLIYPYALDQVLGFGLNPHLTRALALAVGFIFWYVIFYFFLSRDGSKRLIGFTLIATIYVSNSLIMYFITRDNVVDIFTGERAFCLEDQMTGRIKIYSQSLFDQLGKKTVRCTDDQIERYEIEKKFKPDQNSEVMIDQVVKGFISPKSGRALFYYCLDTDGKERFFVVSGHCPWGGGKLEPVTNEIMKKVEEQKKQKQQKQQEEQSKLDLENKYAQSAVENQQMKLKTQQIVDENQQMKDKTEQLAIENQQIKENILRLSLESAIGEIRNEEVSKIRESTEEDIKIKVFWGVVAFLIFASILFGTALTVMETDKDSEEELKAKLIIQVISLFLMFLVVGGYVFYLVND